jgi:hypothetical protein
VKTVLGSVNSKSQPTEMFRRYLEIAIGLRRANIDRTPHDYDWATWGAACEMAQLLAPRDVSEAIKEFHAEVALRIVPSMRCLPDRRDSQVARKKFQVKAAPTRTAQEIPDVSTVPMSALPELNAHGSLPLVD